MNIFEYKIVCIISSFTNLSSAKIYVYLLFIINHLQKKIFTYYLWFIIYKFIIYNKW